MVDRRKSPVMQTTNALIGEPASAIDTLLQTLSEDEIRKYAVARSADTAFYLAGVTRPLSSKWQIGGDIRLSDISGTEAAGSLPAMTGPGKTWTYNAQAIGTGLFTSRDSNMFALSVIRGSSYDGFSAFLSNRTLSESHWTFDSALRWYQHEDSNSTTLVRLTPTFRSGYRFNDRTMIESELGLERTTTKGNYGSEQITRRFFYAGYRWDF